MKMADSLLNWIPRRLKGGSRCTVGRLGQAEIGFAEFIGRVAGWRALLAPLSGQQFALYLEDSIEFSAALLGAWYEGKTVWLAADTSALTLESLARTVDGFLGDFPAGYAPIQLAGIASTTPASPASPFWEFDSLDDQFVGLVVHTSGTTGVPQAIPKKLSQLAIEIATLEQLFGEQCGTAEIISTVSHHHIYGLLFSVLWPLIAGRPINATAAIFPEALADVISTRSCVVVSSPAYLKRLPEHLAWGGKNSRLRALFSSGGVLPKSVAESASAQLGKYPVEIFGSSETGGIAWRKWGDAQKQNDAWQPMPGVTWRVSPGDGQMEVRSPHLPDEAWFKLADRVLPDRSPNGNERFILRGRSDRIVKIEEKRISLDLIEQQIATSSLVEEVKLVIFNNDDGNESAKPARQHLGAVIVLSKAGKALLESEGKHALNGQIKAKLIHLVDPIGVPRRWRYVNEFPLNSQGKITEASLQNLFSNVPQKMHAELSPQVNVVHRDENSVELELIWPANLLYFKGHFPGTSVLPGVVQIDWAIQAGREYFDLPASFQASFCAIHALKFHQVIFPDIPVNLILKLIARKESHEKAGIHFSYYSATKRYSSGRIIFADATVPGSSVSSVIP